MKTMHTAWLDLTNGVPGILLLIVFLTVLTTNFAAFLSVVTAKRVCYATHCFVFSLIIADSMFALSVMPMTIVFTIYGSWPFANHPPCALFTGSRGIFAAVSTYNLAGISIYRLISVSHPHTVRMIFTKLFVSVFISSIWISPFIFWFGPTIFGVRIIQWNGTCQDTPILWLRIYIVLIIVGLPLVVLLVSNFLIYQRLRLKSRFPNTLAPCFPGESCKTKVNRFKWIVGKWNDCILIFAI